MTHSIYVPVHPTEQHLPRSTLRLQVKEGVIEVGGIPLQGPKTLESLLKILDIWKPNIVLPAEDYQI